ncbi:hypothetical protein V500_05820 [Pseudogymnoascus sp. VKM F-4518 (FW-2643)]|nr:hypothetical protein V500_05820 [Pseudogymnoascus sp. VKM F-4518 (FW-2643)]
MDWMSQLHTEICQAEQEKEHLVQENESLEQLLASNEAEFSNSQRKYDTRIAVYYARIAALRREREANGNSMEDKISRLESLNNDNNMKLQTVTRRIEFTKELQQNQNRMDPRKFPAEIRETILKFLLVEDMPICVSSKREHKKTRNLALFYTCKQIKGEAYGIFYGKNVFQVDPKFRVWGTSFICRFSAYLKHIKVHVDSRTSIPDLLQDIQRRDSQLQSLCIQISGVPTYRGSQKPSTLGSLKFQTPSSLQKIEVSCSATTMTAELKKACSILHEVLAKGSYESRDQVLRCSGKKSSARKRQRL